MCRSGLSTSGSASWGQVPWEAVDDGESLPPSAWETSWRSGLPDLFSLLSWALQ